MQLHLYIFFTEVLKTINLKSLSLVCCSINLHKYWTLHVLQTTSIFLQCLIVLHISKLKNLYSTFFVWHLNCLICSTSF